MSQSRILEFLHALDSDLADHAQEGQRLNLYLIGRASLIVRYGLNLATKDVDMVGRKDAPELEAKALALFGKGTAKAQEWGLYLEVVVPGLPPLPGWYKTQSVQIAGDWKVLRPMQLEPHDLAVTKLKRFHTGDREDLKILCDNGDLTRAGLERALDSAFPFGLDDDDDPWAKPVKRSFLQVLAYLEGRDLKL
jgi:hypothetical protein